MIKTCKVCAVEFQASRAMVCSDACRLEGKRRAQHKHAKKKRDVRPTYFLGCAICQLPFTSRYSIARYCSTVCRKASHAREQHAWHIAHPEARRLQYEKDKFLGRHCDIKKRREYYVANSERIRAANRKYDQEHKEEVDRRHRIKHASLARIKNNIMLNQLNEET